MSADSHRSIHVAGDPTVDYHRPVMPRESPTSIHVAGDPTVDWFLLNPTGDHLQISYQWDAQATVRIVARLGGAALLTDVLERICANDGGEPDAVVCGVTLPREVVQDPQNNSVTRTFWIWDLYPAQVGSTQGTWRAREFVGQEHGDERSAFAAGHPDGSIPNCLVLDDTNLGFRFNAAAWPACLRGEAPLPRQIILRVTNPLASGPLWETLVASSADRLTVYLSVGDLRKEYAAVGQPLSWERTSSEVVKAVQERAELTAAARVIVSLGAAGAVIVTPGGASTLVFDPSHQQDDWERKRPGEPVGFGVCIVSALAYEAARAIDDPDWVQAVQRGLQAARSVHQHGYELIDTHGRPGQGFPREEVRNALRGEAVPNTFQSAAVPADEQWDMFASAFPEGYAAAARRIVIEGEEEACRNVPVERMGIWSSMDRTEIESMRSVRTIMREFLQSRRARPLSIAVFGPPGSGKSFAIKQMAREWAARPTTMEVLEFNLSQYAALDELPRAFQRVRDYAVEGVLPLVFWDEFDTALGGREMGWLASFLAPMQDGQFNEAGTMRPIGPAIFVFAGGTHPTMQSFKARASELPGAKATDFLSRLRGFVDIPGPNTTDENDRTVVLRRAFLLRARLRIQAPQIFHAGQPSIDPGILRAFLHIDSYVHGARSMESLIDMSTLSGRQRYERSALPARHQLSLHVDPDRFLALVRAEPAV
ncbi:MAG: AAA family ATPase [Dehalococcoidia bacterium]